MAGTQTAASKAPAAKPNYSRKTLRKAGRVKRKAKLATDKEFAKAWFEGKSKRSDDKKKAFRKRFAKK